MVNRFDAYFVAYYAHLLPIYTNFKTSGQFENLVFVIMSTRENTRLIARTPFLPITCTTRYDHQTIYGILHLYSKG